MGRVEEEGVVELMVLHILLFVCGCVVGVLVRVLVTVFDELKIQDGSVDFIDSGRLCSVGVGVKVGWSNTMGLSCIQRTKQHDEWKTTKVCPTNESNTGFTVTTLWTKKGNPKDTKTNSSFAPYQFEAALTFPGTASESCSELRNGQSRLVKNLN
jgi:hypothetical protein